MRVELTDFESEMGDKKLETTRNTRSNHYQVNINNHCVTPKSLYQIIFIFPYCRSLKRRRKAIVTSLSTVR